MSHALNCVLIILALWVSLFVLYSRALFQKDKEIAANRAEIERLRAGNERLGTWMSAALSDPSVASIKVCSENEFTVKING